MNSFQIVISITLGILSIILIPLVGLIWRGAVKWTRVETKLDMVVEDIKEIVKDKDAVHREINNTMREDRAATDRRLRWLEEHLWKKP